MQLEPAAERKIAIVVAGLNLRTSRERLGLTRREVETASARIADKHGNDEFSVSPSRLSDIETKGLVPSIYRLYSLAVIYRRDLREILSWYGIALNATTGNMKLNLPPKCDPSELLQGASGVQPAIRFEPAFEPH